MPKPKDPGDVRNEAVSTKSDTSWAAFYMLLLYLNGIFTGICLCIIRNSF